MGNSPEEAGMIRYFIASGGEPAAAGWQTTGLP
jgi:hypothetical protein